MKPNNEQQSNNTQPYYTIWWNSLGSKTISELVKKYFPDNISVSPEDVKHIYYSEHNLTPQPIQPDTKGDGKHTPGTLGVRRTSTGYAIDTDNDNLPGWKSNPVFEINHLSPYAEANAARIVLCWNQHDSLAWDVNRLAVDNEALKEQIETGANQYAAKVMEVETLKEDLAKAMETAFQENLKSKELLEALELAKDIMTTYKLMDSKAGARIEKAISKHSK